MIKVFRKAAMLITTFTCLWAVGCNTAPANDLADANKALVVVPLDNHVAGERISTGDLGVRFVERAQIADQDLIPWSEVIAANNLILTGDVSRAEPIRRAQLSGF